MEDHYTETRHALIKEMYEFVDSHEERLERAIEQLGDRYLLHPSNRVPRRVKGYGSVK
jgi:hypothetical protein